LPLGGELVMYVQGFSLKDHKGRYSEYDLSTPRFLPLDLSTLGVIVLAKTLFYGFYL
jgi:hypothetical protein